METFGEEISAEACSGKEIAGLLRKMMMMMMMMMNTRRIFNIDGEREQANWDMAAILELQSVPFSFRNKTGQAAYCKKLI